MLSIPVLYLAAVYIFNSKYEKSKAFYGNIILSFLSCIILVIYIGMYSYNSTKAAHTYIILKLK